MIDSNPPASAPAAGPFHLPKGRIGRLKWIVSLVFLALAVHLLLPAIAGFPETWRTVKTLTWWLVAAALAAEAGSYVGSGLLIQGLVRLGGGTLSLMRGVVITLASAAVGVVAVGIVGSTVAMYGYVRHGDAGGEGAGSAAGLKPVFNNSVLLLVGVFGIVHLLILGDLTTTEAIGFGTLLVMLTVVVGSVVWGVTHPNTLRRFLTRLDQVWGHIRKREPDLGRVDRVVQGATAEWKLVRSGGWERPLLGASINIAMDILCFYLLFLAVGDRVGIGTLLTGYSLALLLGKVAFVPGGIAVTEATMIAIFTKLGTNGADATVAVLAYRLLTFWIPTLFGLPLVAWLRAHSSAESLTTEGRQHR